MVQPRSQSFRKRVRQEAGTQTVARGPDSGQGLQGVSRSMLHHIRVST